MHPREESERFGTIAAGTRVAWKRVLEPGDEADGCEQRWVEIEPFGWICEVYLRPSKHAPRGVEVPRLALEEIVPGIYGKVIAEEPRTYHLEDGVLVEARSLEGSVMVRQYGLLVHEEEKEGESAADIQGESAADIQGESAADIQGESAGEIEEEKKVTEYWRINGRGKSEYLPSASVREFQPSTFRGIRLGDDTGLDLPIGFAFSRQRMNAKVPVYSAARGGRVVARLRAREAVPIVETVFDAEGEPSAYRVGENRWVRAADMRVAQRSARPPETGDTERWLDIDLDEQVLVAYEGDTPVYTTLVSTGSRKYPTPTGIYRIWVKFAEKNMSDLAGEDPYSVATVPWAQFYEKDFALHTAYWHDKFGTRRSHGCTNLSPMDARFLYFWTDPPVPPGWSMAKGTIDHPGSLVRLRSKDDPEPAFQGYAARLYESRKSTGSGAAAAP